MKNIIYLIISVCCLFSIELKGQQVIRLWDGVEPPTSNEVYVREETQNDITYNVSYPEITVYLPVKTKNKHKAVIICPGGGYGYLSIMKEGHLFGKWLQKRGFTSVVLKYRMPNGHKAVPLEDLEQAMRIVRSNSVEWGISDENMATQIGVAGFSAGGHLAAQLSTQFKSDDLRPDFTILFYPIVSMGSYTHQDSKLQLLGRSPKAADILNYSVETHIDGQTPPAILFLSDNDTIVSPKNSLLYYEGLKRNNIPTSMYIFPKGGHGWGIDDSFPYHIETLSLLERWLNDLDIK